MRTVLFVEVHTIRFCSSAWYRIQCTSNAGNFECMYLRMRIVLLTVREHVRVQCAHIGLSAHHRHGENTLPTNADDKVTETRMRSLSVQMRIEIDGGKENGLEIDSWIFIYILIRIKCFICCTSVECLRCVNAHFEFKHLNASSLFIITHHRRIERDARIFDKQRARPHQLPGVKMKFCVQYAWWQSILKRSSYAHNTLDVGRCNRVYSDVLTSVDTDNELVIQYEYDARCPACREYWPFGTEQVHFTWRRLLRLSMANSNSWRTYDDAIRNEVIMWNAITTFWMRTMDNRSASHLSHSLGVALIFGDKIHLRPACLQWNMKRTESNGNCGTNYD